MAVKIDEVRYLTNLTRDHYNLLKETVNGKAKTFTYDGNVVSFEKEGTRNYYQLDELGSTMYLTGTDGAAYSPYAYDPFGNRIDPKTGRKTNKHGYTKEGNIIQPFAFTGYREEESGLYYAQARSYDPRAGRFTGEDKVRGMLFYPDSINHYLYCFNDPAVYVDQNGLWPKILSDIGQGIKDAATGIVNQIKEDPTKFIATVATGIVVGAATAAVAAACVAAAPAGLAAIAVGAVAYGVAGAATGAVSSVVGQVCSKNFDGKINMKEVAVSAIGGAAGGAFFGGIAGASASTASAAASSTAGTAARTVGKYATAFGAGFVGGTAADAAGQKMTTGKVNWGHAVGTGIFSGGMAAGGYRLSQTKVGQFVSRPIQKYIYDPIYARSSVRIGTVARLCSGESGIGGAERNGYYQDRNGRWHRPDNRFASNAEIESVSRGYSDEIEFYNEFAERAQNAGLSEAQAADAFNAMRNGDYGKMASYFDTSSPKDGAVFWSGDVDKAGDYAKTIGGTIMEQTPGGEVFNEWDTLQEAYPVWGKESVVNQKPIWTALSEQYANGASGQVYYVKPASYNNPQSVWLNTELPIIEERIMSGDVTGVNYVP